MRPFGQKGDGEILTRNCSFQNRIHGRVVESPALSSDTAKCDVISIEGEPDIARDWSKSIFDTVSILVDKSAHIQRAKELCLCILLEMPARLKI
jgi:hypothetical protein